MVILSDFEDDTVPLQVGAKVRVPKTAELVAGHLREQIVRGELRDGDVLPSENSLRAQFGVSRPTLREALRILESESLLTIRRGSAGGARVQSPTSLLVAKHAGLVLQHRGTALRDVTTARAIIEVPSVGFLARNRTDSDLERLDRAIENARLRAGSSADAILVHTPLHALIMELADNKTLTLMSEMVQQILDAANYSRSKEIVGTEANDRALRRAMHAHERVVELIRARDAEGAEQLWRLHLAEQETYVLGDHIDTTVLDVIG